MKQGNRDWKMGVDWKGAAWVMLGVLVFWLVMGRWGGAASTPSVNPSPQAPISTPVPTPASTTPKYSKEQRETAQVLMDAAKRGHNIYEERPHLVVEMKSYVEDKNALLRFVRAIADADCVLNNGPRNIYFYNPSMKKIAQADMLNGVRLLD